MDNEKMSEVDPTTYFFDKEKINALADDIAECNRVVNCFDELMKKSIEAQSKSLKIGM